MANIIELPEGITEKDIRFNWNYQRWGLYHNALIEIEALTSNRTDKLSQIITQKIASYRKEMTDYDRFFVDSLDLLEE